MPENKDNSRRDTVIFLFAMAGLGITTYCAGQIVISELFLKERQIIPPTPIIEPVRRETSTIEFVL